MGKNNGVAEHIRVRNCKEPHCKATSVRISGAVEVGTRNGWLTFWTAGREVRVGRFPFAGNGKAIALGEDQGLVKTVFDAKTGQLLGAHLVGAEVTELIQGFVIAMQLETTEEDLMRTVFPHPTLSEMMHESVLDAFGRVIHA